MWPRISGNTSEREQQSASLSIRHNHHEADCESTIFSVISNTRKVRYRRSSRERQYVYDRSFFGPELRHTHNSLAFYIGLHQRRFHVVMSTDDVSAAQSIREAIRIEENTRQTLDLISRDMTTINSLSIMERAEYDSQYAALGMVLTPRAQKLEGSFSSMCWTGARNSFDLKTSQSADPCLLCKMGLQHTIRVLRLEIRTRVGDSSA